MGCRILGMETACFYCSTTMVAFGPVAHKETLEGFEYWLHEDPRGADDIMKKWEEFQETWEE